MSLVTHRGNARLAGSLFPVAIAASLAGGTLIQGVLVQPDLLSQLSDERWTLTAGVSLEVVNALAVIGIVAALWTPLRQSSPGATVGYLGVRFVEATACAAAALIPITLLLLAGRDDLDGTANLAGLLIIVRDSLVGYAVPVAFGAGAAVLYSLLYRSALVPRYIAIWGLVGTAGILANVFVGEPAMKPILALPIIANEIYLGGYLLIKGLRPAALPPDGSS